MPKVACSSIKIALAGVLGIDLGAAGGNPHLVELPAPRGNPASSGPPYPGLFSFAFVRNPWDRLVSCYRDKVNGEARDFTGLDRERGVAHCLARFDSIREGMSFEQFVEPVAAIPDDSARVLGENGWYRRAAMKALQWPSCPPIPMAEGS